MTDDFPPDGPTPVCYLIDRLCRGGTETQLLALINHLDRRRVLPHLCLLDGDDALSADLAPADCPLLTLGVKSLRAPSTLLAAVRFMRFLRRHRIRVLHLYFRDSCLFGIPLARLAGVRRVCITQNNLGYWMTPVDKLLARVYQRCVDATISNCEPARAALIRTGAPADRSVILENGIQLARFHPHAARRTELGGRKCFAPDDRFAADDRRDADGCDRDALRVGMVANLRPVKNPGLFVSAAAQVLARRPDVTFHLAGDGDLRSDLLARIRREGLSGKVILEGGLSDVPRFLAGLDVCLLTSDSEGLSNAILEYMAAGKPVIATAVGGTIGLIKHDVNGLLINPGDLPSLAEHLVELIDDAGRRRRLGAAARQTVTRRFSMSSMANRFENFYESLLI